MPRLALALVLLAIFALLALTPAQAQPPQRLTTTVEEVMVREGVTSFRTPHGVFELDYEVGIEYNDKATAALFRARESRKPISFDYYTETRANGRFQVLTKQSTAALGASR